MIVNLLHQFAQSVSMDNNQARILNWYLEKGTDDAKYSVIAVPTPGLSVWNDDAGSVVREIFEYNNIVYSVIDNKFYSYDSDGVRTEEGTLNTSSGNVDYDYIDGEIMIVDGVNGYIFDVAASTFTTITDPDFVANPVTVVGQDGFFLVVDENSSIIAGSDIGTGTSWNALSFADAVGSGDFIRKLVSLRREVWVLQDKTTEVWQNTGAPTFSFEPNESIFIQTGIAAPKSAAVGSNNLFILGRDATGNLSVYQMISDQGYIPQRISTQNIDQNLSSLEVYEDAIGYFYSQSGHDFYVLTFPTEEWTIVYDLTANAWHERESTVNDEQTRHLSNCHTFGYGKHLVGSYNSGTIYYFDEYNYTDNDTPIYRELQTPPAYNEGKKFFIDRVQIDTETNLGSGKTFTVNLSKDSGHTFNALTAGVAPANPGNRMYWSRLGMTQNAFVFNISTDMNANCILLGATAEIRGGIH